MLSGTVPSQTQRKVSRVGLQLEEQDSSPDLVRTVLIMEFKQGQRVIDSDRVEEHESSPTRRVSDLKRRSRSSCSSQSHQPGRTITGVLPSRGIIITNQLMGPVLGNFEAPRGRAPILLLEKLQTALTHTTRLVARACQASIPRTSWRVTAQVPNLQVVSYVLPANVGSSGARKYFKNVVSTIDIRLKESNRTSGREKKWAS